MLASPIWRWLGPKALDYTFVGLKNYGKLFNNRNFLHSLSLSIQYTIYTNIGQFR